MLLLNVSSLFKEHERLVDCFLNLFVFFITESFWWVCFHRRPWILVDIERCCWTSSQSSSENFAAFRKYINMIFYLFCTKLKFGGDDRRITYIAYYFKHHLPIDVDVRIIHMLSVWDCMYRWLQLHYNIITAHQHHHLNIHFLPRSIKGLDGCFPTV